MNTPSAIKVRIEEQKKVLLSITDVDDFFLTELVGEEVLDESVKDNILDGKTRTEINKRLFDWLFNCNDTSVFDAFLLKLTQYGQKHVANLLLGATTGELPLSQKVKLSLQKILRDLSKHIDLESGLLERLLSINAISENDYEKIKAEPTKKDRAKNFWEAVLRGSDLALAKFKDEIVKTQPEIIRIIEQDGTMSKPHMDLLKKHNNVLSRCLDVNILTIAFLESRGVIDRGMADSLKSTDKLVERTSQVCSSLTIKPKDAFDSFLEVMEKNEQKHVVNLLTENSAGQQPLSEAYYGRIVKIKPDLIVGIHDSMQLISAIRGYRESEETDFAISHNDYEILKDKYVTNTEKNSALIDAVLRRTDYSLGSLETALRDTKQDHMANFLKEGIMIAADLKTTRIDKEESIVNVLNEKISSQSSEEQGSDEDIQLTNYLAELNTLNIPLIATAVSNSILIYTYCKRPCDAKAYDQHLQSGKLQTIYEKILNLILKIIEPGNQQPLEAAIILEERDRNAIQEFIAESPTMDTSSDSSYCTVHGKLTDFLCHGSSAAVIPHRQMKANSDDACDVMLEQLQDDLKVVDTYKSKSIELKEHIENERVNCIKHFEAAGATVIKRCEDLKEKVENFKLMILKDQEKSKEQTLNKISEQIRALDSYVSIVSDFERRVRSLSKHGTSAEVCKSFELLHERAEKLQKLPGQATSGAIEIYGGNLPLIPSVQERNVPFEISEKQVLDQKDFLLEYLDAESGLLEQLVANGILSVESANEIRKQTSYREKNKRLVDILVRNNRIKELVYSLAASKQSHLVNYLLSEGKYDPKFGQIWPVLEPEREKLDQMRDKLPCLFAPSPINWLCNMNVINLWQANLISSIPSIEAKSDTLLEILKRGSICDFFKIGNLLAAYQVVPKLKSLELHKEFLGKCLDPDSGIIDALKSHLSSNQWRSLRNERLPLRKNLKLIDMFSGPDKYDEFIDALNKTGQKHVANYLSTNGVYDPKFEGEWPAVLSTFWPALEANRNFLIENLKLRDFLDNLVKQNLISIKQKDCLSQIHSKHDKNAVFLGMIGRGTLANYSKTIEFFRSLNEIQVAIWLGLPPASVRQQIQIQVQVNLERELAELFSSFGNVLAFRQIVLPQVNLQQTLIFN